MVTLAHLTSDIYSIATAGTNTEDFRVDTEQIVYWVNEVRSMLIAQALQKHQDISDVWVQTIGCVAIQQMDISECCNVPIGCYGLRSVNKLPTSIETDKDNLILSVTGLDGFPLTKTNRFRSRYDKYAKFTGKKRFWFIKDNYLYIVHDQLLAMVTVHGIFEDPSDLNRFVNCSGVPCFNYDSDYPVSLKMAEMITNIVLQTKITPSIQYPSDNANDAANIVPPMPRMKSPSRNKPFS